MRNPKFTWSLLRVIWDSKGYSMKEMPTRLERKWPGRKGVAFASIQRKAQEGRKAPRDIAEWVISEQLPARKGYEKPFKVVRLGLAALRGQPAPTVRRKLDSIASSLLSVLCKLTGADAKLDVASGQIHSTETKLVEADRKLDAVKDKLDAVKDTLDTANGRLDVLQATVTDTAVKIEKLIAEERRQRLTWGVGLVGVLLLATLFGGSQIQANQTEVIHAATMSATQVPQVDNVVNRVTGRRFDLRIFLGALVEMGKKPEENWIPKQPLPGQKLAKDCKASLGEKAIDGGCWVPVKDMEPPCGELFRKGDTCYRPVSADPTKPIGMFPGMPDQP